MSRLVPKSWSPLFHSHHTPAIVAQQQHNTTTPMTMYNTVLFFLGSSGAGMGAGAGEIGGVSISSSKQ
jgi:hypothetical protein